MKREQPQLWRQWSRAGQFLLYSGVLLVISLSPVTGQDIRRMEVCPTEKQMERRTACLQANVQFLQQALVKLDNNEEAIRISYGSLYRHLHRNIGHG
jgi:hypothetical protein